MSGEKRSRRRLVIRVAVISVIASIVISMFVIPYFFGYNFVSVKFELAGLGGPGRGLGAEAIWPDGTTVKRLGGVGVEYYWSNSYFTSVQLHYNGFDFVMLVYNRTVNDPTDVVTNKDYLVWGAFYGIGSPKGPQSFQGSGFDFYASRRNLSNYTIVIGTGINIYGRFFDDPMIYLGTWLLRDLNGNLVSLGTYYIYFMFYAIVAKPSYLPLTVTGYSEGN